MADNERKTIVVTGGAGFLGSNLCERLISTGCKVICIDNLYTGRMQNIEHLMNNDSFDFISHDICNPLDLDIKVDQVYNMACPASPPHYQKNPIFTTKTSVIGGLNVLEFAKKNKASILQASTSEVYGDPKEHPQAEGYRGSVNPIGVRSCYDEGKRCAESLFFDYHRQFGIEIKVARIFNTYGPKMDASDGRVISNFVVQALRGENITIYGDGMQSRSFCYVDDLIEALIKLMNSPADFIGPVNLGNPDEYTVLELSNKIIYHISSTSNVVFKPLPSDDPKKRCPDINLAKNILNWHPQIDLNEGIKKTIKYFQSVVKV